MRKLSVQETVRLFAIFAAGGGFFLVDRWLKAFFLDFSSRFTFFGDWLYLETLRNEHLAFGVPLGASWIVWPAALLIVGIFGYAVKAFLADDMSPSAALLFIFWGAVSNLYDRLTFSFVIDYVHVWWWPVFNLADVLIVVGMGWLLGLELFRGRK